VKNGVVDPSLMHTIEQALHARIIRSQPVHGGDVARSYAVELDGNRRVFAKTHPAAPAHFFTTEAAGLSWLRNADAAAVPEVLAVSDDEPNHVRRLQVPLGHS
jgi:fructosamine-3-kinase